MTSIRQEIRRITQQGPAPFTVTVSVDAVWPISRGFRRVAVRGSGLDAYLEAWPADAFKLLFPPDGSKRVDFPSRDERGMPYWPNGTTQPLLRAYTVRNFDPQAQRIEFDIAVHGDGPAMDWLAGADPGDELGLSGMRREFYAAPDIDRHLIIGDASALPAVAAIVESLPHETPVLTCLAATDESDTALLPEHPALTVHWLIDQPQAGPDTKLERLVRDVLPRAAGPKRGLPARRASCGSYAVSSLKNAVSPARTCTHAPPGKPARTAPRWMRTACSATRKRWPTEPTSRTPTSSTE